MIVDINLSRWGTLVLRQIAVLSVALAATTACSDEMRVVEPVVSARGSGPAGRNAARVDSPEWRLTYVGAYPEIPAGALSTDTMLELGNSYFFTFDGSIFELVRESGNVVRYEVGDDYQLTSSGTVSF